MAKQNVFKVLRIIVGLGLIGYLLATTDLGELMVVLRAWRGEYFVLAVLLGLLRNVVFSYRWKVTLSASGIKVSLVTLLRLYFVGAFFNLFLPTALGGDVVRGYGLVRRLEEKLNAVTSVLVERIVGFFALVCIALLALFLGHQVIQEVSVTTFIITLCLAYFILALLILDNRVMSWLVARAQPIRFWNFGARLQQGYAVLRQFTGHKAMLGQSFLLSLVSQTLAILAIWCLALTISLNVTLLYFFMVVPMIWIITMIPISVNGLGLREGAYVFFFTRASVSEPAALLLSFLNSAQMLVLGLIGGVIYLIGQMVASPMIEQPSSS